MDLQRLIENFGKIEHYEVQVFAGIAPLGILVWSVHFYRGRKHKSYTGDRR